MLLLLGFALAAMATAPVQAQTATETVLHHFASPPQGAYPEAGVVRDPAGNLYGTTDRKSTRLNSSHLGISYAVFCLKKKQRGQRRAGHVRLFCLARLGALATSAR